MSDTIETLGQLLNPAGTGLGREQIRRLDAGKTMTAVRSALAVVPAGALADLSHGIAAVLTTVLDLRLADVLAGAWNTGRRLLQYRDAEVYPAGDVVDLPLGSHDVTSTLHPRVAVLVNGVPIPGAELEFTIALAFTIEAAVLRIGGGRIIGAVCAQCRGSGTLSCGEAILLERETRDFSMPAIDFHPGVVIGPPEG